jgi:hypothetical protein
LLTLELLICVKATSKAHLRGSLKGRTRQSAFLPQVELDHGKAQAFDDKHRA